MRIILASASPRRKELMNLIVSEFDIETADIDERALEDSLAGTDPLKVSEQLALAKAHAVADLHKGEDVAVIGCDTSVILDGEIMGKPADRDEAVKMLTALSGNTHIVATGVAIVTPSSVKSFTECSDVIFNPLDDYQKGLIERYCDSSDPYDKAGAYGIQNGGALLVQGIRGCFFSVVGLPVSRLAQALYEAGIIPDQNQ
ncbi:septum formation protein [Ruminococcaceae bacterium YRB3002]|nr:septum formation protein [Ruminococcaceae bacterium YRB3002]